MEEIGSFCVNPDTHKKYAPVIVADERGAKNDIRFFSAARSLQSRSYAAGGTRYLQADLMLLTHAGCAFKDPGALVSQTPLLRLPEGSRQPEREISWLNRLGDKGLYSSRIACTSWAIHTVSHCCVAQ